MTGGLTGSLVVVGTGFQVAGQVTVEALLEIQHADRLFFVASDPVTQHWLERENPTAESLSVAYAPRRKRADTYAAMVERIMSAVRDGARVCAAFYGHPGVFVAPSHTAIRVARAEGYRARMLPAISAEDCLFADLEVDPALAGCQSYEATSFVRNHPPFDPDSALVLWQIGAVGVATYKDTDLWSRSGLARLTTILERTYASDQSIVVYQGADLPIVEAQIDPMPLKDLASASVTTGSTLYVPPQNTAPRDSWGPPGPPRSGPIGTNHGASCDGGTLTIVGTGHGGEQQVDRQTLAHLHRAERLFYAAVDPTVNEFLRASHPTATDLSPWVAANESDDAAAHRNEHLVLDALRQGHRVCAAFEGHPAIGRPSVHHVLNRTRTEGYKARMLPAISIEGSLVADLGVDPATHGRALYDATTFAHRSRSINTAAALVLIRLGALTSHNALSVFREALQDHYPDHQPVTVYEPSNASSRSYRSNHVTVNSLVQTTLGARTHLYIPPTSTRRSASP